MLWALLSPSPHLPLPTRSAVTPDRQLCVAGWPLPRLR